MGELRKLTLGLLGSSVLAILGFTSCSGNGLKRENVECVYGPPPEFYNDTIDNQGEETADSVVTQTTETQK